MWRGVEGAGEALSNARIYYAEELKPYLRLSKTEWNIPEILKSLTAKDLGIDEWLWQDAKALINKEIEAYAKDTKASLERVHEIMTDFKLSNKKIGWESADWVRKSMNDAIHTKLRNIVNQTLDAENPWFNANSKTAKYGRLLEGAWELKDKAIARWKSSWNSSFREDLMKLIRSPRGQKAIWKWVEWFGKHLKPTTYIKWLLDKIRGNKEAVIKKWEEILNSQLNNVKSNVESTVKNAKETVVKNTKNSVGKLKNKVVESVKSNPKSFRQPKLNFGAIFLWEALDKVGFEMPENVVTELAAYALEMNKLNKEWNRDLPLYDIENSYVNQNPRANMSLDEIAEYNEKNSTNYLNQLQQDVIWLDAFPDWFQERYGLYDDTTMEEQDWWKALEEEEEKNAKNYKDKIEWLTDEDWEVLLKSI